MWIYRHFVSLNFTKVLSLHGNFQKLNAEFKEIKKQKNS